MDLKDGMFDLINRKWIFALKSMESENDLTESFHIKSRSRSSNVQIFLDNMFGQLKCTS